MPPRNYRRATVGSFLLQGSLCEGLRQAVGSVRIGKIGCLRFYGVSVKRVPRNYDGKWDGGHLLLLLLKKRQMTGKLSTK